MCNPVAIMFVGMMVQTQQQNKQAKAERRAAEATAEQQADERGKQLQQESTIRQAQARREKARMIVAQGESGVAISSNSFEASLQNQQGILSRDLQTLRENARTSGRGLAVRLNEQLVGIPSSTEIFTSNAAQFASSAYGPGGAGTTSPGTTGAGTAGKSGLQIRG